MSHFFLLLAFHLAQSPVTITGSAATVELPTGERVILAGVEPITADYCGGVIEKALAPLVAEAKKPTDTGYAGYLIASDGRSLNAIAIETGCARPSGQAIYRAAELQAAGYKAQTAQRGHYEAKPLASTAGSGLKPAPKVPRSQGRISDALLSAIRAEAGKAYALRFLGKSDLEDGSLRLSVTSSRTQIAFNVAKAAESGGRYTPPADQRADRVMVDCGDSDIGDIFHCARVTVKTPDGRTVKPISYRSGPNSYRNAMGARWSVREVFAVYPIDPLRGGFSVDYADPDGTEWTMQVLAKEAQDELLLGLDEK